MIGAIALLLAASIGCPQAEGEPAPDTGAESGPARAVEALSGPLQLVHSLGVLTERRAALAAAWAASTDEGRDAARAALLMRANLGPAALLAPPELALAEATRLARGEVAPGAPYPGVLAVADALDLRLVPGAVAADTATEVAVDLAWAQLPSHPGIPEVVRLRLAVVSPASAPTPAAPFEVATLGVFDWSPRGLTLQGARVPLALPPLAPGVHWIAAELEHDGLRVPGFLTRFEAVAGLAEGLAARPAPEGTALAALLQHGVRAEDCPAVSAWCSGQVRDEQRRLHEPSAAAFAGASLDVPAEVTVFVDVPPPFDAAGWLAGAEGAPWRAFAGATRRVVAVSLDVRGGIQPEAPSHPSLDLLARVAAADPECPRVLVVRGERLGALLPLLEAPGDAFQGLALVLAPGQGLPRGWRGEPADGARRDRKVLGFVCLAPSDIAAAQELGGVTLSTRCAPPPVVLQLLAERIDPWTRSLPRPLPRPASDAPGFAPEGAPAGAGGAAGAAPGAAPGSAPGLDSAEDAAASADTAPPGMARIPASVQEIDGERTVVPAFFADLTEVTNDAFGRFVAETGYVTDAERIGDSVCFIPAAGPRGEDIFRLVPGAQWRHPAGPGSDLAGRASHPVVHVSWNDAVAYAAWCKKRLPTRAEWYAMARGDAADQPYPWGTRLETPRGPAANIWQGRFPLVDLGRDGHRGTAPVASFPPGTHGLFDLGGNVWEWTAEQGHGLPLGVRPGDVPEQPLAATRGGSFLCREEAAPPFHACRGYRIGAHEFKPLEDGNDHVGFRCVRD